MIKVQAELIVDDLRSWKISRVLSSFWETPFPTASLLDWFWITSWINSLLNMRLENFSQTFDFDCIILYVIFTKQIFLKWMSSYTGNICFFIGNPWSDFPKMKPEPRSKLFVLPLLSALIKDLEKYVIYLFILIADNFKVSTQEYYVLEKIFRVMSEQFYTSFRLIIPYFWGLNKGRKPNALY